MIAWQIIYYSNAGRLSGTFVMHVHLAIDIESGNIHDLLLTFHMHGRVKTALDFHPLAKIIYYLCCTHFLLRYIE